MTTATHHDLISPRIDERLRLGQLTEEQVDDFRDFLDRVDRDLLHHRVITDNAYTQMVSRGEGDGCRAGPLRPPVFGVLESVLGGGIAASDQRPDVATGSVRQGNPHERAGGDLPAKGQRTPAATRDVAEESKEREGDPDLVSTEGTVDGGLFRFRAAHFEWLLAVGETLGLGFDDLGKRRHGRPYVLQFCDELQRLFGSEDDQIAEGASFAVENWAAAGFWQELEDGLLADQGNPAARAQGGLLHMAQPRRGPARRSHHGRARRRLLRPQVRRDAVLPGRP